jgi:hypothetical protein
MALIIVEREFAEPQVFETLQAIEDGKAWCLEMHAVTFLRSYFSIDRRRMACLYDAPDAEAVRQSQDQAGLPYTRVWVPDTTEGPAVEPLDDQTHVLVVDRAFDAPMTSAVMEEAARTSGWCLKMYRVRRIATHLSKDGTHGMCVLLAPDAESVRRAHALSGLPYERVWAAQVKRRE